MPRYVLSSSTGLQMDVQLDADAKKVPVQIRLKDALLNAPDAVSLTATVATTATEATVSLIGIFFAPIPLWGGLLVLEELRLTLVFELGDNPPVRSVAATGRVSWPQARTQLGFESTPRFNLGYVSESRSFTLTLTDTLPLPGRLATVMAASLTAEILATRPAVVFTLSGAGRLSSLGVPSVARLLRQLFGRKVAAVERSGSFVIRQELALVGGVPTPQQAPDFEIILPPHPTLPRLPGLGDALDLSFGAPELRYPLGAGIALPADWILRFRDCRVRLPNVPALAGLELLGSLQWDAGANRLLLEPSVGGSVDLPALVRFFLSRLAWLGPQVPLDAVIDAITVSPDELDWQTLFGELLPDPLPADLSFFRQALRELIGLALDTTQIGRDRIFFLAISALQRGGQVILESVWRVWLELVPELSALPELLKSLLGLPSRQLQTLMVALVRSLDPGRLLTALFAAIPSFAGQFNDFLALLLKVLAAALPSLDRAGRLSLGESLRGAIFVLSQQPRPPEFQLGTLHGFRFQPLLADLTRGPAEFTLLGSVLGLSAASPSFVLPMLGGQQGLGALPRLWSGVIPQLVDLLPPDIVLDANIVMEFFGGLFQNNAAWTPIERRRYEELMMMIATFPVVGQLFTVVVLAARIIPGAIDFVGTLGGLMARPINTREDALTLPPGKYIIFSDIHRDVASDDLGPLKLGSIDHFSANKALYLRLLNWADTNGYTVIEAGDCEELWYIQSATSHETRNARGESGFPKRLREIIATHQPIYDKLRELHQQGRYVRVFGNHDSYIRDPDLALILRDEMQRNGAPPFRPVQFVVLSEVKTMMEHTAMDALMELVWNDNSDTNERRTRLERALAGKLGMDSAEFTNLCPMIIMHGHQLDFWNNDANSLMGKLISNAIGVQADALLDLPLDLRGVALGGSPAIDFGSLAADLPVWNNWPDKNASARFAHRVQHMPNADRKLVDDVIYSETFASLFGTLCMSLNEPTPAEANIPITDFLRVKQFFDSHHNHHLCLGHTHNPQSQPYFSSSNLPALGNTVDFFTGLIKNLKSRYLNSGTAGWMEGLIWAIEVGEDKQARLVYWTANSLEPERMDWELTPLDEDVKQAIRTSILAVNKSIDDIFAELRRAGEQIGTALGDLTSLLASQQALPFDSFARLLMRGGAEGAAGLGALSERRSGETPEQSLAENLERIQLQLMAILVQFRGRALTRSTAPPQEFRVELPLGGVADESLRQFSAWFDAAANPGGTALAAAAVVRSVMEGFPRNLPMLGRSQGLFGIGPSASGPAPVLRAFSGLLPLLPLFGAPLEAGGQRLSGRIDLTADAKLVVNLTLGVI